MYYVTKKKSRGGLAPSQPPPPRFYTCAQIAGEFNLFTFQLCSSNQY